MIYTSHKMSAKAKVVSGKKLNGENALNKHPYKNLVFLSNFVMKSKKCVAAAQWYRFNLVENNTMLTDHTPASAYVYIEVSQKDRGFVGLNSSQSIASFFHEFHVQRIKVENTY